MKTMNEIKQMIAAGETAKADEALKELLAEEPDNLQAKMLYGTCRQLLGDEETFRRIYAELSPVMNQKSQHGQQPEIVSLWGKYQKLWESLILGGLVLAGAATAIVLCGRQIFNDVTVMRQAVSGYRGPLLTELRKVPSDGTSSSVSNVPQTAVKRFTDGDAVP